MPRAHAHIRAEMVSRIEKGEILLGDLIEPKTFTKLKFDNGNLVKERYEVHGRKIPLQAIRQRLFQEHQRLGILSFH